MKIDSFEELQIWKQSINLAKDIYLMTSKDQWKADYGLRDQIRRAIVSVSSNIIEGFERSNNNEFIRFLKIAKGSVGEVRSQLYIALLIKYIPQTQFDDLNKNLKDLGVQIGAFIKYLEKFRKDNPKLVTRNAKL